MESRWQDSEATAFQDSDLALRVYTSRLLGLDDDLVLHGGGNTSVKSSSTNIFGENRETLFVKGSGWDLKSIKAPGFAPCDLAYLQRLAALEAMTDSDMMRQLRLSLLDPAAPTPSVEAILHAIIPFKFVDHTHTDSVVAVSNTAGGQEILQDIFSDEVLLLPYIMPGFVLARQVFQKTRNTDWASIKGIFLMHHGLFTFHDEARTSYENMIMLVSRVEEFLAYQGILDSAAEKEFKPVREDVLQLARMRRQVSELAERPMLARYNGSPSAAGFACLKNAGDIATRGPITPDHTIHTKIKPVIIDGQGSEEIKTYADEYKNYFARNNPGDLTCLDPAPRLGVWLNRGMVSFAQNAKRLGVVQDISEHTIKAIQWGEALGGWQGLPEKDLFEVEYWELEQAKLKKTVAAPAMEGKVTLVSGAASGIGRACVDEFVEQGACVIALDINPAVTSAFSDPLVSGLVCDVTNEAAIQCAIEQGVLQFGGLDTLVSNAGVFTASQALSDMETAEWERSLDLNLTSHMKLLRASLPYLRDGIDPAVVIIASKNVPAPGPGAGAYSAAKAGLTQMARVAALELGGDGIRVNVIHPNAVFDTGVWDEETLYQRAAHYGLSVEEYKTSNVLKKEVSSRDVAVLARLFAGYETSATTGAQVPIDGGNDRVI